MSALSSSDNQMSTTKLLSCYNFIAFLPKMCCTEIILNLLRDLFFTYYVLGSNTKMYLALKAKNKRMNFSKILILFPKQDIT